jgi:uncharacterized protein
MIPRNATLALVLILVGCSSPREHLYLLDSSAAEAMSNAQSPLRPAVVLGPVSIPPELDRPQIMVFDGGQLAMSEQDRWALPLKQAIPRALATQLTHRTVYRFVALGSAAIESPSARLAIDVSRFEASPAEGASVTVHWVWLPNGADARPIEGDVAAHSAVRNKDYAGLVEALREATAEVAAQIAGQLPPPARSSGHD